MPPKGEAGMLVPLQSQPLAQSINWARENDAWLLGKGPLPGTIVIQSDTDVLALKALLSGSLLVAVDATVCAPLSS